MTYFCRMKLETSWPHVLARNFIALLALMLVHYIPDRFLWKQRSDFGKFFPYLMLLLMFGWIVFHNRVLFGRLYLNGKKRKYFFWTLLLMTMSSLNMHFILTYAFHQTDTIPKILSFWIFTVTGLGVYVIFLYLKTGQQVKPEENSIAENIGPKPTHFNCIIDGVENQIPLDQIVYLESMENYVKVITPFKIQLVRLSLKEAESKLPKPGFLRISRSHIVNIAHVEAHDQNNIKINSKLLKIGKVYKRYVEEQLTLVSKNFKKIDKKQLLQ